MTDIYHELLEALAETPVRIQELVEGAGAGAATKPAIGPEGWGPAAIIAHLADTERILRGRIEQMLTREAPYLKSFDPDALAGERGYADKELRAALEDFATERAETIQRLMNLPLKGWERSGIHDERGEISVEDVTEQLVDHDAAHLTQLGAALAG
ncbi:MAG TPA: DinB family protein [Thermomicrobiaceae bacterium]|nr:DinB family protein [Thermomicrobiaceae bacterium]